LAKKQKQSDIRKPVTTRQFTRKEREKKTQRIIIIVSIVVLLFAIGLAGFGYYDIKYRPYNETILEINGTNINMNYYLTLLRVYLQGQEASQVETIARAVPGAIINNLLVIQRAPDLGYTVSEDEINKALAEKNIPDEQAYRDIYASSVLTDKLENDYFGGKLPKVVDQVKVMAMVADTESVAESVLKGLSIGQPFVDMVNKFGIEKVTNEKSGNLGWLPKGLTAQILGLDDATVLENTAFSLEPGQTSQPVYDPNISKNSGFWILKVTEKEGPESCRVYGILLGDSTQAQEIKSRIEAGEDFSSLAKQYSQDENSKQDGGDLGWIRKGYTNSMVMEEAFKMDVGQVSEPLHDTTVQTKGGYWIIQVVEKENNRPLDEDVRNQFIQKDMMNWILEQTQSSSIKNHLTDSQQKWAINKVVSEINIGGK
jgi:parvulin-like peptidyl-prolyl isomerase